ncbi:hypothetical protein PEL8287_01219 [Roseovarius litorisediminis]|uniref:Asparagine synthase n=1 Tax=Roseovarius litorisediminis TaxID=1312363 RepID=A0A1Y5RVD0_9RHOB|nr:hypothetical protein [Roseovarius litorisediminis]SLN26243.1 hypothetical protein PEL8287_01219 [Roseovarius litorisediminis]
MPKTSQVLQSNAPAAPCLAETTCARLELDFNETFRLQFRLAPARKPPLPGFISNILGTWALQHCPDLPVTVLKAANGKTAGYCLGLAATADGEKLTAEYALPRAFDADDFFTTAQELITGLGGRYVVFLSTPDDIYVYCDPAGSLSVVYHPDAGIVASSLLLTLEREIIQNPEFDIGSVVGLENPNELRHKAPRTVTKGGFSFGHTADRDVKRLSPNHRLSLSQFTETRFWPAQGYEFASGITDLRDAAQFLAQRLGQLCNALVGDNQAWFALSGGLDSRMVLAAAVDGFGPNMHLYSHAMSWSSYMDTQVASMLAHHFQRDIKIVQPDGNYRNGGFKGQYAQNRAMLHHDVSSGFVAPLNKQIQRGVLDWIPKNDILVRGNMLELVSAVWWPRLRLSDTTDPLEHAVYRCQVAAVTDEQVSSRRLAMQSWIDQLPPCAADVMHDFNYIENTLPYTQSGFQSVNHCFYLPPACDRAIFELCMALPYPARRRGKFYSEIIAQTQPALAGIPTSRELASIQKDENAKK